MQSHYIPSGPPQSGKTSSLVLALLAAYAFESADLLLTETAPGQQGTTTRTTPASVLEQKSTRPPGGVLTGQAQAEDHLRELGSFKGALSTLVLCPEGGMTVCKRFCGYALGQDRPNIISFVDGSAQDNSAYGPSTKENQISQKQPRGPNG